MYIENDTLEKARLNMEEKLANYKYAIDCNAEKTEIDILFGEYMLASQSYRALLCARYNL